MAEVATQHLLSLGFFACNIISITSFNLSCIQLNKQALVSSSVIQQVQQKSVFGGVANICGMQQQHHACEL